MKLSQSRVDLQGSCYKKNESLATTIFWITFLALDKILIKKRCEMSNRSLLCNVVYSENQAQLLGLKNILIYIYSPKQKPKKVECLHSSDATDALPDPIWRLFPCKVKSMWGCGKGKSKVWCLQPRSHLDVSMGGSGFNCRKQGLENCRHGDSTKE